MKCVFTLAGNNPDYLDMAKVLAVSARLNTSLEVICLYDGDDQDFVSCLSFWGVRVLPWTVTFLDDIQKHYQGPKSLLFCRGTYMCTEVPFALRQYGIDDTYVLYVDADMMFQHDVDLSHHQPVYFAAPPDWNITDWSFVSVGVMLLNTGKLLESYEDFMEYLHAHNYDFDFAGHGGADQGAWNLFYANLWDRLEPEYDWKPWWGYNPNAPILHFCGPKPHEVQPLLDDPVEKEEDPERRKINLFVVNQDPQAFQWYLQAWREYRNMVEG